MRIYAHRDAWLSLAGCATTGFPDVVDVARRLDHVRPAVDQPHPRRRRRAAAASGRRGRASPTASPRPASCVVIEGDNFGRLPTVSIGGRATTDRRAHRGRRHRRARAHRRSRRRRAHRRVAAEGPLAEDASRFAASPSSRTTGRCIFLRVDKDRAEPRRQAAAGAGRARGAHLVRRRRRLRGRQSRRRRSPRRDRSVRARRAAHRRREEARASRRASRPRRWTRRSSPSSATARSPWCRRATRARPALFEPMDLPMGAKAPRAIELSPDGKLLARARRRGQSAGRARRLGAAATATS